MHNALISGLFTRDNLLTSNTAMDQDRTGGPIQDDTIRGQAPANFSNRSVISLVAKDTPEAEYYNKPPKSNINSCYLKPVYSISHELSDSLKLTENSDKEEKVRELLTYFIEKLSNRNKLPIQNIIDLNIVPINIHALMRDIPLVNLYNYAYTFDRLILELYYDAGEDRAKEIIRHLCGDNSKKMFNVQSAKDMLVALLINPYAPVDNMMEFDNMCRGMAHNGELGRPKFLSDQIFNKALFGSAYPTEMHLHEVGPPAVDYTAEIDKYVRRILAHLIGNVVYHNDTDSHTLTIIGDWDSITNIVMGDFDMATTVTKCLAISPANPLTLRYDIVFLKCAVVYFTYLYKNPTVKNNRNSEPLRNLLAVFSKFTKDNHSSEVIEKALLKCSFTKTAAKKYSSYLNPKSKVGVDGIDYVANIINENTNVDILNNIYARAGVKDTISNLHWHESSGEDSSGALNPAYLSWIDNDSENAKYGATVTTVTTGITAIDKHMKNRMDTVLIRNLIFIINLYRSVRMKLARDLVYSKDIITRSAAITSADTTEFWQNNSSVRNNIKNYADNSRYKRYKYM
jgi:hypothetical protein